MMVEWILSMIYGLVQPGSMAIGTGGPMDPCPGKREREKWKKDGPKSKTVATIWGETN